MSKKTNDQNVVPAAKVLTTSVSRTVAKFAFCFAAIGLAIGILVMVFLNLGLHEKIAEMVGQLASEEIVAQNASSEETGGEETEEKDPAIKTEELKSKSELETWLRDLGVTFPSINVTYDGVSHVAIIDDESLLPEGVRVAYGNNEHTDAGRYIAEAVFTCAGYEPLVWETDIVISRAKINVEELGLTFEGGIFKYTGESYTIVVKDKDGNEYKTPDETSGEIKINDEIKVKYYDNAPVEHGVYYATAVLYGKNYESDTMTTVIKVVDLSKLILFKEAEDGAITFVYDGNERTFELDYTMVSDIPEFNGKTITVEYSRPDIKFNEADKCNVFKNAGNYTLFAKIAVEGFGEGSIKVNVNVEQGDIEQLYGIYYKADNLMYDETSKEVIVKSSIHEDIPENIKYTITYIKGDWEEEIAQNGVRNPGKYIAVIEFVDESGNCKNRTGEDAVIYEFTIAKRDVSEFFTVTDPSSTGSSDDKSKFTEHNVEDSGNTYIRDEDGNIVVMDPALDYVLANVVYDNQFSRICYVGTVNNTYARVYNYVMTFDAEQLPDTLRKNSLVVTYAYGDVSVVVTFEFVVEEIEIKNDNGEAVIDETTNEPKVEYTYKVLSKYEIDGKVYEEEHDYNNVEFIIPIGFVNYGTYRLNITVAGSEFDADAVIPVTKSIDYAKLSDSRITKISTTQKVTADGTLQLPDVGNLNKDIIVEMYDEAGNPVTGYKYVGTYKVKIVFTKGNYQTTKTVTLKVGFDYRIAIVGIILGMLLGLLVGFITSLVWTGKEKSSRTHFRAPSAIVANARGGIICESYAKCDNSGCTGRLYLSSQSIEFYADDYKALKDNFLIDIDDVRNVNAIAPNKIQVYAKKEVYTFTVPDGTAGEWAHEIVRA